MKEIIEELNLPKQILDKTEKFMSKLLGPAIREFGELFADKVRFKRIKNQVEIFNKTREILDKNGLEPRELKLKTLVPLIEKSSIEDDEIMQAKWAKLIANIATTPENGLEPRMINTLSSLSVLEAKILDFIHENFETQKELMLAKLTKNLRKKYVKKISVSDIKITSESVKKKFQLSDEFTKIYINNLESLGLLRYEEPRIEIDEHGTYADPIQYKNREPSIDFNLDITANYKKSDDFHITVFGNYFINQCKLE
ncbi:Abi-alpha family protein [Winogradskyella forsetii]|uniref:Abi-alpha family protein n=1 Tax=Winogradskyella forsetii TaxID=2686077 RepID=UPI0015BF2183|nr:Abi-alpha family protein [Winogradskyella forsetii]